MPQNKILLTGASGFVGGHVIAALRESYLLHAISHRSTDIEGIEQVYSWENINSISGPFDAVIHMAGLAHDTQNKRAESEYFDVNVGLTRKLLERLDNWNPATFIYLSSVKAVADSTSDFVLNENSVSTAKNVYGRSKLAAEEEILTHKSTYNKVVLRPVLIYGRGQKGNLNTLHRLIDRGVLFPFGKWENQRSVLSINNLTSVITQIIKKHISSGVYFVSDDKPVSTVELLDLIGQGASKQAKFIRVPNNFIQIALKILPNKLKKFTDKFLGSLVVDNTKLKRALGINRMPFETKKTLPAAFAKTR